MDPVVEFLPWWGWVILSLPVLLLLMVLAYAWYLNNAPMYMGDDCLICEKGIYDFQETQRVELHYDPGKGQEMDFQGQVHVQCWQDNPELIKKFNGETTPTTIKPIPE